MSLAITQLCGFGANEVFTPGRVSGLVVWLCAELGVYTDTSATTPVTADAQTVAFWQDQSGLGNNFTQSTSANRPTWKTGIVNSMPVLRFDGSNDQLVGPSLSALTAGEAFIVVKVDADPPGVNTVSGSWKFGSNATDCHYPFTDGVIYEDFGTTARKTVGNPTPSLASWRLYNVISVSGEWTANLDGTQIYTTATNTVGFSTAPIIGGNVANDRRLDGDIAEFIVYNKKLEVPERTAVKTYIANRYALTIS